jgi:carbon storage regulator
VLVLSRNEGDGVSLPELDVSIEILKIQGNRVQVGIHAPHDIRILRSELMDRESQELPTRCNHDQQRLQHELRLASLAVTIAKKHLARGDTKRAELTLHRLAEKLRHSTPNGDGYDQPVEVQRVSESTPVYACQTLPLEGLAC